MTEKYFGFFRGMKDIETSSDIECSIYDRIFADFYYQMSHNNISEMQILFPILKEENKVLELACGAGRLVVPLVENNCYVTGVDSSLDMLNLCRQQLCSEKLILIYSDMLEFCKQANEKYNLIIISDGSLSLMQNKQDIYLLLEIAKNRLLYKDGKIYFSILDCKQDSFDNKPRFFFNKNENIYIAFGQKRINDQEILVNMYGEKYIDKGVSRFFGSGKKLVLNDQLVQKMSQEVGMTLEYSIKSNVPVGEVIHYIFK